MFAKHHVVNDVSDRKIKRMYVGQWIDELRARDLLAQYVEIVLKNKMYIKWNSSSMYKRFINLCSTFKD